MKCFAVRFAPLLASKRLQPQYFLGLCDLLACPDNWESCALKTRDQANMSVLGHLREVKTGESAPIMEIGGPGNTASRLAQATGAGHVCHI